MNFLTLSTQSRTYVTSSSLVCPSVRLHPQSPHRPCICLVRAMNSWVGTNSNIRIDSRSMFQGKRLKVLNIRRRMSQTDKGPHTNPYIHGFASSCLSSKLQRVFDNDFRRLLNSASTATLMVPRTRHSTVCDRAFTTAAARVWNSLPSTVTQSSSLTSFKRGLKAELFSRSYPNVSR